MYPLQFLNEPASQSLKLFEDNVKDMTPINKKIYKKLVESAPDYPQKNISKLLSTMFPDAERKLILEQRDVLDELNFLSRDLPNKTGKDLRRIINKTFEKLFERHDNPKKRFKRKDVIDEFNEFAQSIKDKNLKKRLQKIILKLPTSETSENAFIVKYSTRSSEEIGMKLYRNNFATMEHIIPESRGGKIVIWECAEDNSARGDLPVIQQLKSNPEMRTNLQKHIDRLIEIHNIDFNNPSDKTKRNMLKEYIFTLKNEYAVASHETINLDISALGEIPAPMVQREIQRIAELGKTNYLKNLYKMLQDK